MVSPRQIALHYFIDDLPVAILPASRFQNILERLYQGKQTTQPSLDFLIKQGFETLSLLASGSISYDQYRGIAINEQALRVKLANEKRLKLEAEEKIRQEAMQTRLRIAFEKQEAERLASSLSDFQASKSFDFIGKLMRYGIISTINQ